MSSSTRSRQEWADEQRREQQRDFVPPVAVSSTTRQAGTGTTVRARTERGQALAEEDKPQPLDPHRAKGLTANMSFNKTVRSRLESQQAQAGVQTGPTSAATDYYLAEEQAARDKQARWKAEQEHEQAEIRRRNEEREKENARIIAIRIALGSVNATEAERKFVWSRVNSDTTSETVIRWVYALRDEVGGTTPEWAEGLKGGGQRG